VVTIFSSTCILQEEGNNAVACAVVKHELAGA